MRVAQLPFVKQLRLPHNEALRRRDVFDHPSQKVLNKLERAYRSSELQTLLGILKRSLVGAHRASRRHPGNCVAGHLQHLRGVPERVTSLKPVVVLFSTMKPLTWLSATSRAQTIETSHHGALPIQRFSPLRIHVSPSRFAVVSRPPPAPEPTSGSVRPKQPIFSMRA